MLTLALIAALIFSFLLSGMESAVLSVSRVRVRHAATEGDGKAAGLLRLLGDREGLLGAVTVANHAANVTAFGLLIWRLVRFVGPWGYGIGFVLGLPVFIVLLELVPKTVFRRFPFRMLRALLPLLQIISWFRGPFKVMSRLPTPRDDESGHIAGSRADLRRLLSSLAQDRLLPASAAELMDHVLDYRDLTAASVMLPLEALTAVNPDLPVTAAAQIARDHGLAALPVLGEAGSYLGVFDASTVPASVPADRLVRQLMQPLEQVTSTLPALTVLQRLRRRGRSIALVIDPDDQRPVGLVAEEDLVRPLLKQPQVPK